MKKRILVDLDVVTVGSWDKGENGDLARDLMQRIKNRDFEMVTPSLLLERIAKWENRNVAERVKEFYDKNSGLKLTDNDIRQKIREAGVNDAKLLKGLRMRGIGGQDAFLVLIATLFGLEMVTFNRKTLRSKEQAIKEVMGNHGINAARIIGPEQL